MVIGWADGLRREFSAPELRDECRCAACRHELTGEKLLQASSIPASLTVEKADIVGSYALGFQFSDGHSTGIYSFALLRRLAEGGVGRVPAA